MKDVVVSIASLHFGYIHGLCISHSWHGELKSQNLDTLCADQKQHKESQSPLCSRVLAQKICAQLINKILACVIIDVIFW